MFKPGDHISKDEQKAYYDDLRKQHEWECETFNKAQDCHMLAEFYQTVDGNYKKAAAWYKTLCDERDYSRSCSFFGTCLLAGRGTDKDPKAAFDYFKKGCALGSVEGCHNAGMMLRSTKYAEAGVKPDGNGAISYFKKACDQGFRNGCFMLSVVYLRGEAGAKKDMPQALKYAKKACDLQHTWGCINAVKMLETGDGVPKDVEEAKRLRKRAQELVEGEGGNVM
ncbi:hypothetical protein PTSG_11482 [Salpingoeca rosetta]|uniref:Uncharacterized protein n=1 Tax=Salpingoeca rosetta (strain ATCC 50818 / BSB-021) TaxID=946362 RepID=F2UTL2_SALR5|nr:uncharacterized protein PTSG_11482 [Salpingoeca rosetta]EGD72985.1 hypothetical protein PTSG_11482 [Salpingoeca rosetta]|eukprot:XP_004987491.1 hypothetical protein PTSG_11482 [Salpingoeca rosetta]